MAINKTYEELVESAKPKLTTDDCYTPENVYSVIRDYVAEMNYLANYGIDISFNLDDLHRINKLDNQPANKSVYGGGYLLNPAAADRLAEAVAVAEAVAEAEKRRGLYHVDGIPIELSDRERKLCGID